MHFYVVFQSLILNLLYFDLFIFKNNFKKLFVERKRKTLKKKKSAIS